MYNTGICALLLCWFWLASEAGSAATFTPLGYLPDGTDYSEARDVSGDGNVVVGASRNGVGDNEAFRWTKTTGMQGLGDLPGGDFQSDAQGVSMNGNVVVGTGSDHPTYNLTDAFRWTPETGIQPLGHFPTDGFVYSYGEDVSGNGLVTVGTSGSASGPEACYWTSASGPVGIGDLPGGYFSSDAIAVSRDGSIIVGSGRSATASEPYRWTAAEGMVGLGFLPGRVGDNNANAISPDGTVIVGNDGQGPWRWSSQTGFVPIPVPGRFFVPTAVSENGDVIVGYQSNVDAFIWDELHGTQNLKTFLQQNYGVALDGWQLIKAEAISDDGKVIVGYGKNPLGQYEAWIVNLAVPEPSTLVLAASVFALLAIRRRHRG